MKYTSRILSAPKAVLFDWNGTIIKSSPTRFVNSFNKAVGKFGYKHSTVDELMKLKSISESFDTKILCEETKKAAHIEFKEIFKNSNISHNELVSGSISLLEHLKLYNIPTGIVSNLDQQLLEHQILELNLRKYFSVIVGA